MFRICCFLLLLSGTLLAEDLEQELKELSDILAPQLDENKFLLEIEEDEFQEVKTVMVKSGTPIYDIKSHQKYVIPGKMYLNILHYTNKENIFKIISKKGPPRFYIYSEDIVNIDKVVAIETKPKFYKKWPKRVDKEFISKSVPLTLGVQLHAEKPSVDYLREINAQDQAGSAIGFQIGGNLFLDWDFMFYPGLTIQYHQGIVRYDNEEFDQSYKWLSIGPIFSFKFYQTANQKFNFIFGVKKDFGLKFENATDGELAEFSSNTIEWGLEAIFPGDSSLLVLGLHLQNHFISFEGVNTGRSVDFDDNQRTTTIGFSIGIQTNFNL